MKIDWKARLQNPVFWFHLAVAVFAPILAAAGIGWEQVTSWPTLWQVICDGVANPVVVVAVLTAIWAAITDPTTAGLGDKSKE